MATRAREPWFNGVPAIANWLAARAAGASQIFNAERAVAGLAQVRYGVGIARASVLAGSVVTSWRVAYACWGSRS